MAGLLGSLLRGEVPVEQREAVFRSLAVQPLRRHTRVDVSGSSVAATVVTNDLPPRVCARWKSVVLGLQRCQQYLAFTHETLEEQREAELRAAHRMKACAERMRALAANGQDYSEPQTTKW